MKTIHGSAPSFFSRITLPYWVIMSGLNKSQRSSEQWEVGGRECRHYGDLKNFISSSLNHAKLFQASETLGQVPEKTLHFIKRFSLPVI